jgi:sec-independent protein translocase protein TatC
LTAAGLADKRKYAIVIAFIVAAVLTPPDPVSQLGLALPTILLYEVSIWLARMVEKKRAEERAARDEAETDGDEPDPAQAETAASEAGDEDATRPS